LYADLSPNKKAFNFTKANCIFSKVKTIILKQKIFIVQYLMNGKHRNLHPHHLDNLSLDCRQILSAYREYQKKPVRLRKKHQG